MNEHKIIVSADGDADRNNDGEINFKDIPREQRDAPPVGERVRYDDEVPDERDNIRRLKSLKAQDVLEERARRRKEAEHDAIIQEEAEFQRRQNRSPAGRVFDIVKAGVSESLERQTQSRQPRRASRGRAAPARSGSSANPAADMPSSFLGGKRRHDAMHPAPQAAPARAGIADGLTMFSRSVMGGGGITVNSPAPRINSDDQLRNFTANLLGGSSRKKDKSGKKRQIFKLI